MSLLKTMISIFTSIQLLFMQAVIPIAITQSLFTTSVAYAENDKSDNQAQDQQNAESINKGLSQSAEAEKGQLTKVFKGMKPEAAGDMLNFIMMMILGILTAGLFKCEKKTADILIAAAGGALYIGAEIMQLFKSKAKYEQEAITYKTNANGAPELDTSQIEAFEKQKQGFQEAKDAALGKSKMQKAAAAAWGIASITALAASFMLKADAKQCDIEAKIKSFSENPACVTATNTQLKWERLEDSDGNSSYKFVGCSALAKATVPCSAVTCQKFSSFVTNACASCAGAFVSEGSQSGLLLEQQMQKAQENYQRYAEALMCKEPQEIGNSNKFFDIIEKMTSILFPSAHAKSNPLITIFGGLGAGVAIVYLLKEPMKKALDFTLGTPLKRGITFGVLAGIGLLTSKKNEKVAEQMQQNIDQIDKILNRFNALAKTNSIINDSLGMGGKQVKVPLRVGTPIGTETEPFPCVNTSKDGKCLSTQKAIEQKFAENKFNLPDSVTKVGSLAGGTADSIAGQSNLKAGALSGINSLASNAANINKMRRVMQGKINDQKKNQKLNPIDFKKKERDFLARMQGSMLKTLKRKGISGQKAFTAVAPAGEPSLGISVKKQLKNEIAKKQNKRLRSAEAKPTGSKNTNQSTGFKFDLNENGPAQDELILDEESLGKEEVGLEGLAEGELDVEDIVEDSSVSIFKVISVRYLKSGYPRVLKKKAANGE